MTKKRGQTPFQKKGADPLLVTIDGPAGSGKSTVAKLLARRLRVMYLDTGATYRALAYAAVQANLNPMTDTKQVAALAHALPLQMRPSSNGDLVVRLARVDITRRIRTEEVSEAAAQVSQYPKVRAAMVALQRRLAQRTWTDPVNGVARRARPGSRDRRAGGAGGGRKRWAGGVVVEGRDTGSVVFPHAAYKFFLTADPTTRARRRQRELERLYGSRPPLTQIQEQLHFRDGLDRHRRVGPLIKPKGAVAIDTTRRTALQVVRIMLRHITKCQTSKVKRQR